MKLLHKIKITGKITVETGLHIGGSETALEIGGIDQSVIKDPLTGLPYIPGSSLKGKLRDLLARHFDYLDIFNDREEVYILFGEGANKGSGRSFGKLIVRDAFVIEDSLPNQVFEDKAENTIDRATGKANPRHLERVNKGTQFRLDIILDIYEKYSVPNFISAGRNDKKKYKKVGNNYKIDNRNGQYKKAYEIKTIQDSKLIQTIKLGFSLLENDYLGGSGTRGYGKVKVDLEQPVKIKFNNDGSTTETIINNIS